MWSYYGAKTNVVGLYPPPKYGKIIEPFAGTARYALKYWDREVLLVDKYDVIVKIWKWLQLCSPGDILKLPRLKKGERLENFIFDCDEAKMLMGYLIGFGTVNPRNQATVRMENRPNYLNFSLCRIAANLSKIKHWDIRHGSYENIKAECATWFIDPPYQIGGTDYKWSSKDIDFSLLAKWCMGRQGQVIVCESGNAKWLPFIALGSHKVRSGIQHEVFWTNEETSYSTTQSEIIF